MNRAYPGLVAPGHFLRLLFDPTAPTEGVTKTEEKPQAPPATDPDKAYKDALAKVNGDNAILARDAFASAERLRAENAELKGKLPASGSVVLSADEAKEWEAFKGLGTSADVKTKLTERDAFDGQLKAVAREKLHAQAAALHKMDPDVLAQLAGSDLAIEINEEKRNGKDVKVAQVVTKTKDAKGADVEERVDLDKHAEKHWAKFLPSLKLPVPKVGTPSPTALQSRTPRPEGSVAARPARRSAI